MSAAVLALRNRITMPARTAMEDARAVVEQLSSEADTQPSRVAPVSVPPRPPIAQHAKNGVPASL
jgi:hypothetical protein